MATDDKALFKDKRVGIRDRRIDPRKDNRATCGRKRLEHCSKGHLMSETRCYNIDGSTYCGECQREKNRLWHKKKILDPEYKKRRSQYHTEWQRERLKEPEYRKRFNERQRKSKYGIHPDDLSETCDICGKYLDYSSRCIDHDHNTGKYRGTLCGKCNSGIGFFEDNTDNMLKAIVYLKRTPDSGN